MEQNTYVSQLIGNDIVNSITNDEDYYQCIYILERRQASVYLPVNSTRIFNMGLTNGMLYCNTVGILTAINF